MIGLHQSTRNLHNKLKAGGLLRNISPAVVEVLLSGHSDLAEKREGGGSFRRLHPGEVELAKGITRLFTELKRLRALQESAVD
jgi:hypothetical protein